MRSFTVLVCLRSTRIYSVYVYIRTLYRTAMYAFVTVCALLLLGSKITEISGEVQMLPTSFVHHFYKVFLKMNYCCS